MLDGRWSLAGAQLVVVIAAGSVLPSCGGSAPPANSTSASSAQSCEVIIPDWIAHVKAAPDIPKEEHGRGDLPVATIGGVVGKGRRVDIRPDAVLLDGEALPGDTAPKRLAALEAKLAGGAGAGEASVGQPHPTLYLSVNALTDVRSLRMILQAVPTTFDVQLLIQAPGADTSSPAAAQLSQLPFERDPDARTQLAHSAYAQATTCAHLLDALTAVPPGTPQARWSRLRTVLIDKLPSCDCHDVNPTVMRELLAVERRVSAGTVGSLPLDFMRDARCGASLGQTPLQNVVKDIQLFDERYSATQQGEELVFESVLTNDRLVKHICQALPGETLASLQNENQTFYWRVPGVARCQPWQFQPRERKSPMGTWRYQGPDGQAPLAVHYVQAAEEVTLSGPVTDERAEPGKDQHWACTQDFVLRGVDENSIELDAGRWYFDEQACEAASPDTAQFPGCIATLASQAGEATEQPPAAQAKAGSKGKAR
jgi:hypothetical protein